MDMLLDILMRAFNPSILALMAIGSTAGMLIGALPGLTVTMATAILVSLTFTWGMDAALAMILGVYCGGVFAGTISAVLINIPGAPAAVVSGCDGFPLAKRGEASYALSLARIAAFIGSMFGMLFMMLCAPFIAKLALSFSPFEYLALVILGLICIGNMSEGKFFNALMTALIGLLISTVGTDPMYGVGRFTFGSAELLSGIPLIPCLIGIFGISEVLEQLSLQNAPHFMYAKEKLGNLVPKLSHFVKLAPLILRCSLIGTWVGALPGEGGTIAAILAYDHAKRTVKKPSRPFGQGAYEGMVAPEAAANAAVGGSLTTLLTLGIPGDAVTAVLIGAFMVHGLMPGPLLMEQRPDLFWLIVIFMTISSIMFLFIGLAATRYLPKIIGKVEKYILMPIVVVLCVIGAYALESSTYHVLIMFIMGLVGFILKLGKFPVAPLIIGIVLGPLSDSELRRAFSLYRGEFWSSLFTHPIALGLLAVAVWQLVLQTSWYRNWKERRRAAKSAAAA